MLVLDPHGGEKQFDAFFFAGLWFKSMVKIAVCVLEFNTVPESLPRIRNGPSLSSSLGAGFNGMNSQRMSGFTLKTAFGSVPAALCQMPQKLSSLMPWAQINHMVMEEILQFIGGKEAS